MHVLTCSSIVGVTSRCQACNILWPSHTDTLYMIYIVYIYLHYMPVWQLYIFFRSDRTAGRSFLVRTFCVCLALFPFPFPFLSTITTTTISTSTFPHWPHTHTLRIFRICSTLKWAAATSLPASLRLDNNFNRPFNF